MSRDDSDKDSVGFINGRPAKVELDGKITYMDKKDQIKVGGKKSNNNSRPASLFVRRLRFIVGIVVLIAVIYFVIIPFFETGGGNADTREVPGDDTHFDPIANFAAIKAYAGEGALLTDFSANYVRSDGTMDLTADYSPSVRLEFVIPTTAPANAPPIGAGGAANGQWYIPVDIDIFSPGQWRSVTSSSVSYTYINKGMERDVDDPTSNKETILADPTCPFATMWQEALKHDAPQSAVAIISYDEDGYDFSISDVSVYLEFDTECRLTSGRSGSDYFDVPTVMPSSIPSS